MHSWSVNPQRKDEWGKTDGSSQEPLSPGIHSDEARLVWALVTEHSAYAIGATATGHVVNLHWGARLVTLDDLPDAFLPFTRSSQDPSLTSALEEYPGFGGLRYGETVAKVAFSDGVRDLDLRYERFEVEVDDARDGLPELTVYLRDAVYPFQVALHYQVDIANDLIIRSATLSNLGADPVLLERAFSAVWYPPRQYATSVLITLAGQWSEEMRLQRHIMTAGTIQIESRRGITSLQATPWFAIETGDSATTLELRSEVYFGTLAWSGNWIIRVSTDINATTAIAGGISDHDFAWRLGAGEAFSTPDFVAGFTSDGFDGVRQRLHRYTREIVLPQPHACEPRPVLYNSWEATSFNVDEAGQFALAERAARLGVELFVVDDGWFLRRRNDRAGLGDWRTDPEKFPQGLGPLVDRVNALGMQFGLWVEPEMVNPESELYRAHPDWVYSFQTRPRSEARNQLVLNLGRKDVWAYLFNVLDALLNQHMITFLKWDMNRPISEPGWTDYMEGGGEAREVWVRHTEGVYALMNALRARHPYLSIESCASGGGRADLGILRHTDQVWTSDNTHPEARLFIQEGFSLMLPARVMGAWVTDAGRGVVPLAFRFHVAMLGALGIGGNLLNWSTEELDEAARWISVYKVVRSLVQEGEQSWLISPHATHGALAAVQYTSPDQSEAVIFAFQRPNVFGRPLPPLRLRNLDANTRYLIETADVSALVDGPGERTFVPSGVVSGAALMGRGLPFPLALRYTFASCLVHIRHVSTAS